MRLRADAPGARARRRPERLEPLAQVQPGPLGPHAELESLAAAPLTGSPRERDNLDGLFVSCPGRSPRPPPPDAFFLPLLTGCRLPAPAAAQRGIRARFPGGAEEGEFFPLFDGIFLPCRNGLSLIPSYFCVY